MPKKIVKIKETELQSRWSIKDSENLYNIDEWGIGFFKILPNGNLMVCSEKDKASGLDLPAFIKELQQRSIELPVLLRFTDILRQRLIELNECFHQAIEEYDYQGVYRGVYPIKVNQHRHVVEDILKCGQQYHFGLEAGSKPELILALALHNNDESLIICNGYKDESYIKLALTGRKMGKKIFLVIEKMSELDEILKITQKLSIKPLIGVRVKLSSKGSGNWEESGGDRSKFGLFISEILVLVEKLKKLDLLDCFQLLHFHLGSQITNIQSFSKALRESSVIFTELCKLGVPLKYYDVGGGLAVDYDGSKTSTHSSSNYNMLEYAHHVVSAIGDACHDENIPHPTIISESGRSLVAHHSVLVVNILDSSQFAIKDLDLKNDEMTPETVKTLQEVYNELSEKNFQEAFHDALEAKEEALSLFIHGYLSLEHRAEVESLFWAICQRIVGYIKQLDFIPDEFKGLERYLCDIYFCNFSVFQSCPDHWAVNHLFPIIPLHRLDTEPTRRGILVDITCDSDGKIKQFIDRRAIKHTLELHELEKDSPYFVGIFLVGAYQEILGDLHNLFGDTNMVHVSILPDGNYLIDKIIVGETVSEVLDYVAYSKKELVTLLRKQMENCIQQGLLTIPDSTRLLKIYEHGMESYTYLLDP